MDYVGLWGAADIERSVWVEEQGQRMKRDMYVGQVVGQ